MAAVSAEPPISPDPTTTSLLPSSSPQPPTTSNTYTFPSYAHFPAFYTLQSNLTTRSRQFELWSSLITSYCAHHHLWRLSLSALPADLFRTTNPPARALKPSDIRIVLEWMARPDNGPRIDWIPAAARGEQSNSCYVFWRTPGEWADLLYAWVDETGQKGAVLTVYELREGDAVGGREWSGMDEGMLRKVLGVIVKRGKAQVFGLEESAGVKFF